MYQATVERAQAPSHPLGNTPFPFISYKTPADEVAAVSYEYVQQQDERTALSHTLINDVNEGELDVKRVDDGLCDLLLRHFNDTGSEAFRNGGEVVSMQPNDGSETQNSCDHETSNSSMLNNPDVMKTYACSDVCCKPSNSERTLRKHMQPYVCYICTKAFVKSSILAMHLETHIGDSPYKCHMCHKQFTRSNSLKRHMLTHTGERPHKCNVCHRQFTERGSLKMHMLTHTGERPHKCDVCDRQFTERGHLKKHMLIHTGERPYKCDICHEQFKRCGILARHMLTHTGERPHECDVCHRQFTLRNSLTKHLLTHTGERPHKCNMCATSNLRNVAVL